MFKQLFFLHKSENEQSIPPFYESVHQNLEELTGKKIKIGKIENNLLLDQKYSYFFGAEFESKTRMDELMSTNAGKLLTKSLMDFHKKITIISINYDN